MEPPQRKGERFVPEGERAAGRRSVTLSRADEEASGSSCSSTSSLPVRPTRRLLRVLVTDYPTGVALFHHSWHWKGEPHIPGVAKVLVALYKLSHSLGGKGDARYVLFDPPPEGRRRSQHETYSRQTKRSSGAGFRPIMGGPRSRKPRIRCVFSKAGHVIVGLFHEIGDKLELPKQCGDAILREFVSHYSGKLDSLRQTFDDMIDEKKVRDCALTQEQVLELFVDFERTLNTIEEVVEFSRLRSAKDNSSAGMYTFSFSLTEDAVELIKRERKKLEEDSQSLGMSEAESEDNSSTKGEDDTSGTIEEEEPQSPMPIPKEVATTPPTGLKKKKKKKEKGKKDKKDKKKKDKVSKLKENKILASV